MEQKKDLNKIVADFIYSKPEVVVVTLQQFGYKIDMNTATLEKINKLTWEGIYNNPAFKDAIISDIQNDGSSNFVGAIIGAFVSIATTAMSNATAKKIADKQRDLQKQIALTQIALDEKLSEEKIRVQEETARTGILVNSLQSYREFLVSQGTQRLKDTWIYVTGIGLGLGVITGVYIFFQKD